MRLSTAQASLLAMHAARIRAAPGVDARDSRPRLPHPQDTTPHCTWWLNYEARSPCRDILEANGISMETFSRWNPTVGAGCAGMQVGQSYCVEAAFEPATTTTTTTTTTDTSAGAGNGVETPSPIQPGLVSNCDMFYLVQRGDTCATIAARHGITQEDLTTWNPNAGAGCASLWAEAYACVSVVGYSPTRDESAGGVETPSPAQPGMVANCVKFHLVAPGETCTRVAARNGISVAELVAWNPNVGRNCEALWSNAYACVGMAAFRVRSRYQQSCGGAQHNDVTVARVALDGMCINTDCQVSSLDVAAEGICPDGQVQISYWENAGCTGQWFGYGYTSRATCRDLWSGGWKFKSLHLRCVDSAEDCVSKNTCRADAPPENNLC